MCQRFLLDPNFSNAQHASNAVCVSKPDIYADGQRPRDTRDFCGRLGINLPDEELDAAMKSASDKADEDSDCERVTAASLADD